MHWTEEVHRSALVDFLAALVDGIEKDETEAVQAILRSHTMEANERSIWIKSDLELLDAHELWLTLLGVFTEVSLFFSLIKDHIADTVIHAQIYKYLIELFEIMVRIRNNQVSLAEAW